MTSGPGNDPKALMGKGRKHVRVGQYEEAIECFDRALEAKPQDPYIMYNKAIALSSLGRHDEAYIHCKKALAKDPKNSYVLSRMGIELSKLGKRRDALNYHQKALKINPSDPVILYNMAVDLSALERHEEAYEYCKKALNKKPKDPDILNRTALELHHLERFDDALKMYNKALKIRPHDPVILYNKAVDLSVLDQHKESLVCCNKALKQEPDDPEILNRKGIELRHLGRFREAEEYHEKALKIRPRDSGFLYNKAADLSALGMHKEAVECCEMALGDEPSNPEILSSMAVSLSELGRHEEALDCCRKALRKDPKNHWIRDLKATVRFNMGNLKRSMKEIIEDKNTIIIMDTNIWLSHYRFVKGNYSPAKQKSGNVYRAIMEGKAKTTEITAGEFYVNMGNQIRKFLCEGNRHGKPMIVAIKNLEESIDDFRKLFKQIGIRHSSLGKEYDIVLRKSKHMFKEIWNDESEEMMKLKTQWAKKYFKINQWKWDKLDDGTKKKHIAKGPPIFTNDFGILVTAATLAAIHKDKTVTILTNDKDFLIFAKYIMRTLRVEVKNTEAFLNAPT